MTLLQTLLLYLAVNTAVSFLMLAAFLWLISKPTKEDDYDWWNDV